MLRFACKPDRTFTKLITVAITEAIREIESDINTSFIDDGFAEIYFEDSIINSFGNGIEGRKTLVHTLKNILKAHKDKNILYMPTDLHFKLLDRIIKNFCECYFCNMEENDDKFKKYYGLKYKNKFIHTLDYGDILDTFFWDTDYDFNNETATKLKNNKQLQEEVNVSDSAINASLGISPDLNDLTLTIHEIDKDWNITNDFESLWFDVNIED